MAVLTEGNRLHDVVKGEQDSPPGFSREVVTIESGEDLAVGAVIGKKTATGKCVEVAPAASDGSEAAYGLVIADYDATSGDVDGVAIVRNGYVNPDALVWPAGATTAQKTTALGQLYARGLIERKEV